MTRYRLVACIVKDGKIFRARVEAFDVASLHKSSNPMAITSDSCACRFDAEAERNSMVSVLRSVLEQRGDEVVELKMV